MDSLKNSIFFGLVLVPLFSSESPDVNLGPKLNISSYELILRSGENFAVLCEGYGPLEWDNEEIDDEGEYSVFTTMEFVPTTPRNQGFTFASEMRITNITFPYVGIYYCMLKENDSTAPAVLYLYVHDENHLALSEVMFDHSEVIKQGDEVVLPCIPTAPDVEVTLLKENKNKEMIPIELGFNSEGKYYDYSQFSGFSTDDTSQIQLMSYICTFKRGNFSESYPIHVHVEPETHSISMPSINEINPRMRNIVGETISLKCQVKSHVRVEFSWVVPHQETFLTDDRIDVSESERDSENPDYVNSILTVENASLEDSGTYTCVVYDYQEHENENSINITIYDHLYILLDREGCSVYKNEGFHDIKCSVGINAHPLPNVTWLNNKNETIPLDKSQHLEIIDSKNMVASLEINNITLMDVGVYTLIAVNQYDSETLQYLVDVIKKPAVELKLGNEFQFVGEETSIECIVTSYPEAAVQLMYKPCFDDTCEFEFLDNIEYNNRASKLIASVEYIFKKSGVIKCVASGTVIGESENQTFENEVGLFISDIKKGFAIESQDGAESNDLYHIVIVTTENSLELECAAFIQNFTQRIKWKRGSTEIIPNAKYEILTSSTEFSNSSNLLISDININDKGFYTCELYKVAGETEELIKSQSVTVSISQCIAPILRHSNLNSTIKIIDGSNLELICVFKGEPKPIITWYKNNNIFTSSDSIAISTDRQKITFSHFTMEDEGLYTCEGKNMWGTRRRETKLIYKRIQNLKWYGIIIVVLTLLVMVAFVTTINNHMKKRKLEKVLEDAGLKHFEEGQLDNWNPELGIGDQVELLPYDCRYEFSFKNLKLGKILGSGAFGVVVLGEARGILPHEKVTTVAVKMVDRNAQQVHIKALVAELKILIHLGKHLNVVNLLGACTKNIAKRELLVIEEYCRYGNLQTYLYRGRVRFINQIDYSTGRINFEIKYKYSLSESTWINVSKSSSQVSDCLSDESTTEIEPIDQVGIKTRTETPEKSITEDEENISESICEANNGVEKQISTEDLLSWSFQVARGMEYLVSRRVLHGDLAARNILLSDNNVVKICDFGLAKRIYNVENYKKTSDDPLPVKWMAIESIRDRVFSSESDVWSFGIVLWELFSLANTPYPGMEADEKLFAKLENGYRMEAPKYSNFTVYQIMLDCWLANPLNRPTFSQLSERLGLMLEDSVRTVLNELLYLTSINPDNFQHYIKLNDPYVLMNTTSLQDKEDDYLKIVSPPSFEYLSTFQNNIAEKKTCSEYVNINPTAFCEKTEKS